MTDIRWAPRIHPEKIRQLYLDNSKGIVNHDLLSEVGISFYARARSLITIDRIHTKGIVECPVCQTDVTVSENRYICRCGWNIDSKELHQTYKGKQATGASMIEFAKQFIEDWNRALGDSAKQMLAIDFLIHRFHWEMTNRPTRPVAVNFIDGTMTRINELIAELACSEDIRQQANRQEWIKNKELAYTIWNTDIHAIRQDSLE